MKPTAAELFLQKRIKHLRSAAGITQADLAEKAGISQIYYQAIEAGRRRNVSLRVIEKIAAAYSLAIHELFAPTAPPVKLVARPLPRPHKARAR